MNSSHSLKHQRGMATLLISLVLLTTITIVTLTVAKTSVHEQRVSGNEYRTKEAREAAEAGLEYGLNWLTFNYQPKTFVYDPDANPSSPPSGVFWPGPMPNAQPNPAHASAPTAPPVITAGTNTFDVTVDYQLVSATSTDVTQPQLQTIRITATATAQADSQVTASVSQSFVTDFPAVSAWAMNGPPIALNGCMGDITEKNTGIGGTPDIYVDYDAAGDDYAVPPIVSNQSSAGCLQPAKNHFVYRAMEDYAFYTHGAQNSVLNQHKELEFKAKSGNPANDPSQAGLSYNTVWEFAFGSITKETVKDWMADEIAAVANGYMSASERTIYWINCGDQHLTGQCGPNETPQWHKSMGSASHPVILIFDKSIGCPTFNGGTGGSDLIIYGWVYIERGCPSNMAVGWGNAHFCGSVLVEGDLGMLNSNPKFFQCNLALMGAAPGSPFTQVTRVSGTWMDF